MRRHLLAIAATTVVELLCAAPVIAQADPLLVPASLDSARAAEQAARREFGNVTRVKEVTMGSGRYLLDMSAAKPHRYLQGAARPVGDLLAAQTQRR